MQDSLIPENMQQTDESATGEKPSWRERWTQRRENQRHARQMRRLNKKAAFGSRTPDDKANSWCSQRANGLMMFTTVGFVVMGIILIALGIYGLTSRWAEMFTKGPGTAVVVFGVLTIAVALLGYYGFKKDNKCMMLIYFLILMICLLVLVIVGCVALFNGGEINERFSNWWCDFPDSAASGQEEFDCCGYECYMDRPAGGACAVPVSETPGIAGALSCGVDNVVELGKAACAGITTGPPGCKQTGLDYVDERFIPLFACTAVFGIFLLVGFCVSFYLICRPSENMKPRVTAYGDAVKMNKLTGETFMQLSPSAAAGPLPGIAKEEVAEAGAESSPVSPAHEEEKREG